MSTLAKKFDKLTDRLFENEHTCLKTSEQILSKLTNPSSRSSGKRSNKAFQFASAESKSPVIFRRAKTQKPPLSTPSRMSFLSQKWQWNLASGQRYLVRLFPSSIYPEFISNAVLMPRLHIKTNDNLSQVFLLLSKFCHNKNKRRTILSQSL